MDETSAVGVIERFHDLDGELEACFGRSGPRSDAA
jgi:hypothetical protein